MSNNTNLTTGTIFDENGYDEMQRTENHEIGYKLFSIMFFVILIFSIVLVIVCRNMGDMPGMIVSIVLMATIYGFYITYAYMTAKKGIMNPRFAKSWSSKCVIPFYIVMALVCAARLFSWGKGPDIDDISLAVMWLIMITGCIGISLCAMKNNRVVKAQLEEDSDE